MFPQINCFNFGPASVGSLGGQTAETDTAAHLRFLRGFAEKSPFGENQTLKKRSETPQNQLLTLVSSLSEDDQTGRDFKDTVQNRTYLSLKDAILSGRFLPGAVVTLRRLSEMLGTSEMPAREALKRLTAEGAFEALPNRSARIPKLSRRKILQILDLRIELEGKAAEQAAENISMRQIDELEALQQRMNDRLDAGQIPDYTALNKDFHFLIYRTAANEPLLTLIDALWLRMAPVLGSLVRISLQRKVHHFRIDRSHHDDVVKAFRSHDAAGAKRAIQTDLFNPDDLPDYWDAMDVNLLATAPELN